MHKVNVGSMIGSRKRRQHDVTPPVIVSRFESSKRRPETRALTPEETKYNRDLRVIAGFTGSLVVVANPGPAALPKEFRSMGRGIIDTLYPQVDAFELSGHRRRGTTNDGLKNAVELIGFAMKEQLKELHPTSPKQVHIQDSNDDRLDGSRGSMIYEAVGTFGMVSDLADATTKAQFNVSAKEAVGLVAIVNPNEAVGLGFASELTPGEICIVRNIGTDDRFGTPVATVACFHF